MKKPLIMLTVRISRAELQSLKRDARLAKVSRSTLVRGRIFPIRVEVK